MKKKRILSVLAVLAVIILAAGIASYIVLSRNPNLIFSLLAKEIKEGETREVTFEYEADESDDDGQPFYAAINGIPLFKFTPPESAGYTFTVTDIKCNDDLRLNMSVMSEDLEDYADANNKVRGEKKTADSFSAEASLQRSRRCYILIEPRPDDRSVKNYSGSLVLTVTKTAEEEKPPEITPGESVTLSVGKQLQACAVFTPSDSGYYKFTTSIDPARKTSGYSMISSVTGPDRQDTGVTDGICLLEAGREYYVWVSVYETNRSKTNVVLSCESMETVRTGDKGEIMITGDTVIEYRPSESGNIAVYSVSDGDPKALIYEKSGFPLRTDDDSESSLSDNTDDFAVAFSAGRGGVYRICVSGGFTECRIVITGYIGDGSTLTRDDVEPLPQPEESRQDPEAEGDLSDDPEAETESMESEPDN